jgi:hypothetical protein
LDSANRGRLLRTRPLVKRVDRAARVAGLGDREVPAVAAEVAAGAVGEEAVAADSAAAVEGEEAAVVGGLRVGVIR